MKPISTQHITVLLHESIELLSVKEGDYVFEGTLGNAGHTHILAEKVGKQGKVFCTDLDEMAISVATDKLRHAKLLERVVIVKENFRNLDVVLLNNSVEYKQLDCALFDLGLRTEQLFLSGRGFSFKQLHEPPVMTFSSDKQYISALDILNEWEESTIADILFAYGDERRSRSIAKAFVTYRKHTQFETVNDIILALEPLLGKITSFKKGNHTLTRIFQALRIATNDEYEALSEALKKVHLHLKDGGRCSVISFHSGEDRIVKHFINNLVQNNEAINITKKPILPSKEEITANPRSRSSKLRVWEKKENTKYC